MPRTKEQNEEIREKSRSIIADAALELFVTNGYHSTSISMIAKKAGIAIGLMYHYFKSKEELLVSIVEEHLQHMKDVVSIELGKAGEKDIRLVIDSLISAVTERSESWRLIISVMFQPDVAGSAKQLIEGLIFHQEQLYESYFTAQGVRDPSERAKTLVTVMHGAFLSFALTGDAGEFDIIRKNVVERLLSPKD